MRSTINICNCEECVLFCFLLFFSTGSGSAITLYWHLLHSSLSGATSPRNSTLGGTEKNVYEMTVEMGFFSGRSVCYLVSLRAFTYNRYDAVCSFLLSMLLAPSIVRLTVDFWQWFYEALLCVVGFHFLVTGPKTTGTTFIGSQYGLLACALTVLIFLFI